MSNISTALEIQQACKDSIYDFENMVLAAEIAKATDLNPEVLDLLLKYSASLSATVASRVTHILMSESELGYMISELKEMESWDV